METDHIIFCEHTGSLVLARIDTHGDGDGDWFHLHNDTVEQDIAEVTEFVRKSGGKAEIGGEG